MKAIEQALFLGMSEEHRARRYSIDALLAIVSALAVTGLIFAAVLYPKIPNISFLYLLVVLALASTRGLYAAVIASLVAFLSFDYFLVEPLYTFTVNSFEEWLALFIFLITAITTGQLAAALRQRAEQATLRAREMRVLYELVNATTSEKGLERQLDIVARAIVSNFSVEGVYDCAILLPDAYGKLILQADALQPLEQVQITSDEEKTAQSVMVEGRITDVYAENSTSSTGGGPYRFRRVISMRGTSARYVRLVPLQQGEKVVGVARLMMNATARRFPVERNVEAQRLNHQTTFFWTFLDQATAMIERARLHQDALQVELLQRTDALRSALLSSVSHDLRTPLSSIKAAASSLLQEDVEWDEETKRSFALAIEREADRLNRLVGNLLDMSRIEGGALKAEKEWYPLEELINDVLGHMQTTLQGRDVRTAIPADLPPVELDYLQMDQVLTNLLENAVRYTPQESPIEISARAVDRQMLVSIADRGPGIPPYDLERIFDKFYRVSGAKRRTSSVMGTGLGLAVCRGLVEAHGGRIWAENRPGGGAIFSFTLPLEPYMHSGQLKESDTKENQLSARTML
jgi:two-component system sensor histidine kinase KdpD